MALFDYYKRKGKGKLHCTVLSCVGKFTNVYTASSMNSLSVDSFIQNHVFFKVVNFCIIVPTYKNSTTIDSVCVKKRSINEVSTVANDHMDNWKKAPLNGQVSKINRKILPQKYVFFNFDSDNLN